MPQMGIERTPDTTRAVVGSLTEWLTQPEQDSQRSALTVYILRDLSPSRAPEHPAAVSRISGSDSAWAISDRSFRAGRAAASR